jgi:hypothetical protein
MSGQCPKSVRRRVSIYVRIKLARGLGAAVPRLGPRPLGTTLPRCYSHIERLPRLHRAEADASERGGMEERQRAVGIAETLRQRRQRIVVEEDGDNQLREKRKDSISALRCRVPKTGLGRDGRSPPTSSVRKHQYPRLHHPGPLCCYPRVGVCT